MRKHGEKPRYGIKIGHKCLSVHVGEVIGEFRIVMREELLVNGQVLLDHVGVVALKKASGVLGNELAQRRKRQIFTIVMQIQEGNCQTICKKIDNDSVQKAQVNKNRAKIRPNGIL